VEAGNSISVIESSYANSESSVLAQVLHELELALPFDVSFGFLLVTLLFLFAAKEGWPGTHSYDTTPFRTAMRLWVPTARIDS
jgi:hypothetical protein